MSLTKQIAHSAIWGQAGKMVQFPLTFLFSIIIARLLGSEDYGIYATLISVCTMAFLFSALGFEEMLNINLPKMYGDNNLGKAAFFLKKTLFIRTVLSLLASIVLYLFSGFIADLMHTPKLSEYIKFATLYVFISNIYALMEPVLTSYFRQKSISIIRISELLVKIAITLFLFIVVGGMHAVIIALMLSSVAGLILFIYCIRKELFKKSVSFELKPMYSVALMVWLTNFINYLLGKNTDILCMGYFSVGNSEIGFYNIAFTLTTMFSTIAISGFGGVTLAASARVAQQFGNNRLGETWRWDIQTSILLSVPILLFSIAFAEPMIRIFYSDKYIGAVLLLQVFVFFHIIVRVLGGGAHSTVFYAANKAKLVLWLRLVGGLFNLLLDIILIPKWGALGAVVATSLSGVIVIGFELIFLTKLISITYPFAMTMKLVGSCLISMFIVSRVILINNLPYLVLACLMYTILFISSLFFLKPIDREYGLFIAKIHPKLGLIASKFE
jgi:O-antigen/teichoic acid export membrane protein